MQALTVRQPWATALALGIKPLENRSWWPTRAILEGEAFAVHAGIRRPTSVDIDALAELMEVLQLDRAVPTEFPLGQVVGLARLSGAFERMHVSDWRNPWWVGPGQKAWCLDHVAELARPVTCSGAQKLWVPSEEVRETVLETWNDSGVHVHGAPGLPKVINLFHFHSKRKRPRLPRLPEPFLYIGRRTPLGNPFPVRSHGHRALALYKKWLWERLEEDDPAVMRAMRKITSHHHLGCTCKPGPCHGDVVASAWNWLREAGRLELPKAA